MVESPPNRPLNCRVAAAAKAERADPGRVVDGKKMIDAALRSLFEHTVPHGLLDEDPSPPIVPGVRDDGMLVASGW